MNFKGIAKGAANFIRQHSTKILAGLAILSEAAGFYFMHKEAPIVRDRLDELDENAKWTDKLKVAAPVYLPAIGMFLLSSGSIVGGCVLGEKRIAAVTSLYTVTEAMARKTEEKLVEVLGDEKAKEVHSAVAKDILNENPKTAENVIQTKHGNILFFEPLTGRYFRSSVDAVKNANVDFKNYISNKIWGSVNDWYEFLDIGEASMGNYFAWNVTHTFEPWLDDGHTDDGELCWVIRNLNEPVLYNGKHAVPIEDHEGDLEF